MPKPLSIPLRLDNDNYQRDIRPRLSLDLVSTKDNKTMLENIPHYEIADLSVLFRIDVSEDQYSSKSILINNDLLDDFGITFEQLKVDALDNAPKTFPVIFENIPQILSESLSSYEFNDALEILYCASVRSHIRGAGVLAYPDFYNQAEKIMQDDFFILPSSIHEIILLKDTGKFTLEGLQEIVESINASIVQPSEKLSDNAYHYNSTLQILESAL